MENNTQISDQYDDEIDLRELFSVLWAGKVKIIAITAVFAVASVIYALSVPNQYKATALLAPAQSDRWRTVGRSRAARRSCVFGWGEYWRWRE